MKKAIAAVLLLVAGGIAAWMAHQAVERDHEYQRLIRQGDDALSHGQSFVAIEDFSGAIALKRGSMLAYLKRGEAHRRRGDTQETLTAALRDLRTAAELDPASTKVQEELGDINMQLRRYQNAVESYEAYLRLDDHSTAVFYKLALAARAEGQLPRAMDALRSAIRLNPSFAEAHYMLGLCFKERGQNAEALAAFNQAITVSPAFMQAREEDAELHQAMGDTTGQIEQLEAIAALDPARAERLIDVGRAYAQAGNFDTAVTVLGRAAERFQDYPGVYAALGEVWLAAAIDRGDKAAARKALEALEPVATRSTASSEILGLYGRALALNGQTAEAEAALRDASQKFPIDTDVLPELATLAQRLGHLDVARDALVRYAALGANDEDDRDQAQHAALIGDLSMQLNDPPAAVSWFAKSERLAAPDAALLARLAEAELRTGKVDDAKATIARAVAKDAKNPLVRSVALRIERVAQPVAEEVKPQNQ